MNDYNHLLQLEIDADVARREQAATTPADRAFAIAQGEQGCREQAAQPEAQPTNIHQYKAVLADYKQKINAERREAERLRDRLAQIIAIAEDALVMAKDRYAETSYARRLEAIEAAKEVTK